MTDRLGQHACHTHLYTGLMFNKIDTHQHVADPANNETRPTSMFDRNLVAHRIETLLLARMLESGQLGHRQRIRIGTVQKNLAFFNDPLSTNLSGPAISSYLFQKVRDNAGCSRFLA